VSDIDTEAADSLKALDPKRPIREADIAERTVLMEIPRAIGFDLERNRFGLNRLAL
jgi:hypothetical protein